MPSSPMLPSALAKREKSGRRVEFSPSLSSIDSQAQVAQPPSPSAPTGVWDTETDHMLSYFLGGEAPNRHPPPDFASSSAVARRKANEESESDTDPPPPTPAVQHFFSSSSSGGAAHGRAQHGRTTVTSNPNSSSSLSSMAAALVSGGPMVQQQFQQHLRRDSATGGSFGSFSPDQPSPISPAALIGLGQENLMLPAPSRNTPPRPGPPHPGSLDSATEQEQRHQQHMAFLRDLNERAKLARTDNSNPSLSQAAVTMHTAHVMGYYPHHQHHLLPGHPNPFVLAQAMAQDDSKSPVETEEKRNKRLERNRLSARKSRRKKKERLATLEAEVNKLHNEIEAERSRQINMMVDSLKIWRREEVVRQVQSAENNGEFAHLESVIRYSGPFSSIALSVMYSQYSRLKYLTLPSYQKFLLWCALREEAFFMTAKEDYARRELPPNQVRPTGKASSKQIGEDLFAAGTRVEAQAEEAASGQYASSYANDASRTWPLFCFDLKFSVDQEERFIANQKKAKEMARTGDLACQMAAAMQTVDSLRFALESVSRAVTQREENSFVSILRPNQVAAYQVWLLSNRDACRAPVSAGQGLGDASGSGVRDASLYDICKRLNEVLRISKAQ